jgi:hypothetical protein
MYRDPTEAGTTSMTDEWRSIERGLFESPDGQWRIANPWKLRTELRHRWLVAERRSSGSGWCMHDGDHASLEDARAYVEGLTGGLPTPHSEGVGSAVPVGQFPNTVAPGRKGALA